MSAAPSFPQASSTTVRIECRSCLERHIFLPDEGIDLRLLTDGFRRTHAGHDVHLDFDRAPPLQIFSTGA